MVEGIWRGKVDVKIQLTCVKHPEQGKLKNVAFVKDADGYRIEIVEPARLKDLGI